MYRFLHFIVVLFGILLLSCDGRISKERALDRSISEFKLRDNNSVTKYIPEEYVKGVTDSILSNGYRISIKTSTDMTSQLVIKDNSEATKEMYRHHVVKIEVQRDDREVLNESFDIKRLKQLVDIPKSSVIRAAYLDEERSLFQENISIKLLMIQPETKKEFAYNMIIQKNGNFKIIKDNART